MGKLVLAYAVLEIDRARFVAANGLPAFTPLPAKEAEGIKESYFNLGRLRRKLGDGGGGWLDEIDNDFKPRIDSLNDDFRQWLGRVSDDDIKKDAVIAEVKQAAKDLRELNQVFGDDDARSTEIDAEINRRLK